MTKTNHLKIAIVQMSSSDNVEANCLQIKSQLNESLKMGKFDLIVFPENALYLRIDSTTPMKNFDLSEDIFQQLHQWCLVNKKTILLGSVPVRSHGDIYNATILIGPKERAKIVYKKIHLFDVDVEGVPQFRESDQFQRGVEPAVIDILGWKIGLSICYDLRFSELYLEYAKQEVDLIFVPAAFLVPTGKAHWHVLLRARAIESQCFVVAPAQKGPHISETKAERHSFGHALIVSPWGEVLVDLGEAASAIQIVELDHSQLSRVRKQIPMKNHRHLFNKTR